MKSIKILSLFLLLFCAPQLQVDSDAQITMKKCSVCGKPVSNCAYNGNHPKCSVCGKVKEQCAYRGNHPKCSVCGKYKDQCPYSGSHPVCDVCGKLKENCEYKGNHPLCSICGKLKEKCQYKGNHPKCQTCGKVKEQCQYKGDHPKCTTCGKVKEQCQYKGNHPQCSTCGKLSEQCEYKGKHPVIQKETFTANGVSFVMIKVEGNGAPYYIGETEVTQELWKAVMGSLPPELNSSYYPIGNNLPVICVNYDYCEKFIRKLSILTGKKFRLPTEEDWIFAAKGGRYTHNYQYSGSNIIDEVCWYNENSCKTIHPVKTKKANELGIYDMSGNVEEWTSTRCGSDYVACGGSWVRIKKYCTVSYSYCEPKSACIGELGFRLAL